MPYMPAASRKLDLTTAAGFIQDYWPQITRDICAVGVAILGVWLGVDKDERSVQSWLTSPPNLLLMALAIIGVVGGTKYWMGEPAARVLKGKIRELEDDVLECNANYSDLLQAELAILASKLGFTHDERISAYKHDGQAFVMLGRFSSNPLYDRPGRGIYPDNQGCIRDVWRRGKACGAKLPNPNTNLDEYVNAVNRRWDMDSNTVVGLRMKSRSVGGFRIEDRATGVPIAVVILESMRARGISHAILEQAEAVDDGHIGRFLERMRAAEPTPTFARSRGF